MSTPPPHARVLLVGREGCHLCEDARDVVARVCAALGVSWAEVSVDEDDSLPGRYSDLVPVVLVDGAEHAHWHVDEDSLRAALRAGLPGPSGPSAGAPSGR